MRRWYGLALAALLGVVLSGCGGGGGGAAAPLATMTLTLRTLNGATPTSAAWVAYQDGEGVWKTLAPKSAGVYTAKLTAADGRYGLAIAAPAGTQPAMTVYQGTLAEMATVTHLLSPFSPGTFTLGGQFLGAVPGTDTATVALGLNTAMSPQLAPYQLAFLPAGTCDVAAVRRKLAPPHIDKIFLRRALSLKGNATLDIDFSDAAQAFTPQAFTLTCPGMTSGNVTLRTPRGTLVPVSDTPNGDALRFVALPPHPADTDDLYLATATMLSQAGVLQTQQTRTVAMHAAADRGVTLPPTFNSPIVTEGDAGQLTARWNTYANALAYNVKLAPASGNQWSVWISAGWLRPGASHSYPVPILSHLAGWQAAWSPAGGDDEWTADAVTGNRPLAAVAAALATGAYADGMEVGVSGMGVRRP